MGAAVVVITFISLPHLWALRGQWEGLFLLVRMNHNILVFSSLHDIILHIMQT